MTLIEIFVVISIIGILVGLILPAIMASRNAGRKTACATHLRQIGVALQNFNTAEMTFPAGAPGVRATIGGKSGLAVPREHSPLLQLLPYLEEVALSNSVNLNLPFDFGGTPENATASSVHLATFLCPSETSPLLNGASGPTSYRANLGPGPYLLDMSQRPIGDYPAGGEGPFVFGRALRSQDFADGLSQTVLMSERLMGDGTPSKYTPQRDDWCAGLPGPDYPAVDVLVAICAAVPTGNPSHVSTGGKSWFISGFDDTLYNHTVVPNSPSPNCKINSANPNPESSGNFGGVFGASGQHGDGVNCLFGDGSVKYIRNSVNIKIWRAFATRNGGEVLSTDF